MIDQELARTPEPAPEATASHTEHFEEGEERKPPYVRVMALVRWALIIAMATIAVYSLRYVYQDESQANQGDGAVTYYCPMHPAVVQDQPGTCPICNMSLVPKEEAGEASGHEASGHEASGHEASGHDHSKPMVPSAQPATPTGELMAEPKGAIQAQGTAPPSLPAELSEVELSQDRIQLIGMRTALVRRTELTSQLRSVGYVTPAETGISSIQTRFSGWIEELHVMQTGQAVRRGQLLARVYSPELLSVQQELLNAKSWNANLPGDTAAPAAPQPSLLESARSRLVLMGMLPAEVAEIERSGQLHRVVEVRSPAHGVVTQKNALPGLYIQPGIELFQIVDLTKVWVVAEVSERDAARIRIGQSGSFTLGAYPGEALEGRVQLIYPSVDANTRTLQARLALSNPALRLRPGMYGEVTLTLPAADGLVVPRDALVDTGDHQYVFVVKAGGRFEPRAVRVGARTDDDVHMLSGLSEGERVVTTGNFLIDSESRLRSVLKSAQQAAPGAHTHGEQ